MLRGPTTLSIPVFNLTTIKRDIQHKNNATLHIWSSIQSVVLLSVMRIVTNKPCMVSIVVLNVITLSVILLNVVAPCCMSGCSAAVFTSSVTEKKVLKKKREGGEKKKKLDPTPFCFGQC
jgi:hypothetical protein